MKRYALFVGIDDYPDAPLKCARNDAKALYGEFRTHYDATSILTDREASPERIAHEIEKFQQILSPGDMFLFYFSGHGCEQGGDRVLAVPHYDVKGNYMEMFGFTINILKGLTDVMGVHRLFVLDCCRSTIQSVDNVAARGKMAGYMARHGSKALIQPIILSSSAPGQCSYEHTSSGHGYFTEAFLATIRSPQVRSFNVFRDRLEYEMQILHTPGAQNPYFEAVIGANIPFWPSWDDFDPQLQTNSNEGKDNKSIGLRDVRDAFSGISDHRFYIGGAIPKKKRRNAWNSMRVRGHDSSVLALFDSTFLGGSNEGFVIASDGFYAKNFSKEAAFYYRWQDIRRICIDNSELKINESVAHVGTLVDAADRESLCEGLKKLVVVATGREIGDEENDWHEGMPHPDVPHIVAMAKPGKWRCEAGYVLKNPRDPQAGCVWMPGKAHPKCDHVVAAKKEGKWEPESGYWWLDQNDKNDYRVSWLPGSRLAEHVYSSEQEGVWCCDEGYRFANPDKPLEGAVPVVGTSTGATTGHGRQALQKKPPKRKKNNRRSRAKH